MAYNKKEYNRKYSKETGYAAQNKYKKQTKSFLLQLNKESDREVIEKLESVPNKIDYIRKLIQADIGMDSKD